VTDSYVAARDLPLGFDADDVGAEKANLLPAGDVDEAPWLLLRLA
jgi:hypothetical protein